MSSNKALEEKKQLMDEIESLRNASTPDAAAQEIVGYIHGKKEPLANGEPNDWTTPNGPPTACCTIQ